VGPPDSLGQVFEVGNEITSVIGPLGPCRLLFTTSQSETSPVLLWITDGTNAGTHEVNGNFGVGWVAYQLSGLAITSDLWRTDGTRSGSFALHPGLTTVGGALADAAVLGDLLLFAGNDDLPGAPPGSHGYELWRTDGTVAGTFMLAELIPGAEPQAASPSNFRVFGSVVLFDDTAGNMWRTDGTAAGTFVLAPLRFGPATALGDQLLFVAEDAAAAVGLWRTDGTAAGTVLLQPLGAPAQGGTSFYGANDSYTLTTLQPQAILIASASPGRPGVEDEPGTPRFGPPIDAIWTTDGSVAGTKLMLELPQVNEGASGGQPVQVGDLLYFLSSAGSQEPGEAYDRELWRTDGTAAGTLALAPIWTWTFDLTSIGGEVFFPAQTPDTGVELWRTDGNPADTGLISDIDPGPANSLGTTGGPRYEVVAGAELVFEANDGAHGTEPWVSDGTAAGTRMLADIYPGSLGSAMGRPYAMNGGAYFMATAGSAGFSLWRYVPPR
jgi:ELWxxDGT repeat protein